MSDLPPSSPHFGTSLGMTGLLTCRNSHPAVNSPGYTWTTSVIVSALSEARYVSDCGHLRGLQGDFGALSGPGSRSPQEKRLDSAGVYEIIHLRLMQVGWAKRRRISPGS
jgi:hypothetical protein